MTEYPGSVERPSYLERKSVILETLDLLSTVSRIFRLFIPISCKIA